MEQSTGVLPLKEWRLRHHMTLRGLAREAGVSTNAYMRAERGGPTRELTQRKIADALRLQVSQIAEFAASRPSHAPAEM